MKKMFALIALCAMVSTLIAVDFNDPGFKNGKFTLPVVYTGMLKINGWGDEGLCYNWQQTRNSYPLFLGLCQPCLDCVPCDIDMRHAEPQIQYGDWHTNTINAVPAERGVYPDQTEAYFNRARLYLVNNIDARTRTGTVKVIDLIDAYWGKDDESAIPVLFQFYNTVDSKFRTDKYGNFVTQTSYGRIAAMYQFPIYSRDFTNATLTSKKGNYGLYEMADVVINQFDTDGDGKGHTNNHSKNIPTSESCVADRVQEDGVGLVALVGVKDYKAFFKLQNYPYDGQTSAYPVYTIKSFSGDFFARQYEYLDADFNTDPRREDKPLQYVCRKGENFVFYNRDYVDGDVPASDQTEFDGKGAWYCTGSITLRRNDSVTKYLMDKVVVQTPYSTCIPCQSVGKVQNCRQVLDNGIVEAMIGRQYYGWELTYIVDLDNDGIYGETSSCGLGHRNEVFAGDEAYLRGALVNISAGTDPQASNNWNGLGKGQTVVDLGQLQSSSSELSE